MSSLIFEKLIYVNDFGKKGKQYMYICIFFIQAVECLLVISGYFNVNSCYGLLEDVNITYDH